MFQYRLLNILVPLYRIGIVCISRRYTHAHSADEYERYCSIFQYMRQYDMRYSTAINFSLLYRDETLFAVMHKFGIHKT